MKNNSALLDNLNILIKCVKRREELHLSVLDYIKKLIATKDDFALFIDEELRAHKAFQQEITSKQIICRSDEEETKSKWAEYAESCLDDFDSKLVVRLCMRIMQICQASYEKLKQHSEDYDEPHKLFISDLTQLLGKARIDINNLAEKITTYTNTKFTKDWEALGRMIEMIENGEKEMIGVVFQEREQQRNKRKRKPEEEEANRRRMLIQNELRAKKEKERAIQRLERIKEEAKLQEALRRKRIIFVERVLLRLYSVADLSKMQLIEDLGYTGRKEDQIKKVYEDMLERNRMIQQEIKKFSAKRVEFDQRTHKSNKITLLIRKKDRQKPQTQKECEVTIQVPEAPMDNHNRPQSSVQNILLYHSTDGLIPPARPASRSLIPFSLQKGRQGRKSEQTSLDNKISVHRIRSLSRTQEYNSQNTKNTDKLPMINQGLGSTNTHSNIPMMHGIGSLEGCAMPEQNSRRGERYKSVMIQKKRLSEQSEQAYDSVPKVQNRFLQVPLIQISIGTKLDLRVAGQGQVHGNLNNMELRRKKDSIPRAIQFAYGNRKPQQPGPITIKNKNPNSNVS